MKIQHFHLYHLLLFISIQLIIVLNNKTAISVVLSLNYLLIFLLLFQNRRKQPMTSPFSPRTIVLYVIMQWIMISLLIWAHDSLLFQMIIALVLLLLYVGFTHQMSVIDTLHLTQQSIQDDMSDFDDTLLSIRAQRHDFLKHVNALHYFLEERHYEQATHYMKDLIDNYDIVNESIKGEKGHIGSLLFQQAKRAEDELVTLIYRLDVPASNLPLQPIDQMNLLANLLENAIEAAAEASVQPKEVILSTSVYGGIYRLEIVNTTNPIPHYILDKLFQTFNSSTKGGHHEGLGTYIIHEIVNRYKGQLDYSYDANIMTILVTLPIITNRKKTIQA